MTSLRPPRGLVFDVDGCLLDTEPLYTLATERVLAEYGHALDFELKARTMGRSAAAAAKLLVDTLGLPLTPEQYLERSDAWLVRLLAEAPERAGAGALVRRSATHVPLAVCTSSRLALHELKTARHPWFSLFSACVTGDDPELTRNKPAPDPFLLAARRLRVAPEDCIAFEDSPSGVEAALAAGMRVIALPDPRLDPGRLAGAVVVAGWSEVTPDLLGF